ncbi:MAG: glycosyltransferase family 2 protein [Selenomonadaceae bacterium]|nr:glycosyltransferase family 2 protein [Selenomonadaceae bacterium]
MANKVVVITVTKIESDIVESFVRHTLTFADEIIIADNGSSDGTWEILQHLRDEGLPLHCRRLLPKVEFAHDEMMLSLLWDALDNHGADLVLPLDTDEFLIGTEPGISCRDVLRKLPSDDIYALKLVKYNPEVPYVDSTAFLLQGICRREAPPREVKTYKVVVGAKGLPPGRTFRYVPGCHSAYAALPSGDENITLTALPDLHLAHFHWRSDERYLIKSILGWPGMVCQYTAYTANCSYMKDIYESIIRGNRQGFQPSFGTKSESVNIASYCAPQVMRYGNEAKLDGLATSMLECVKIAEAYVEEKVLRLVRRVDLLLPYFGDMAALRQALCLAREQTYPHINLFILNLTASDIPPGSLLDGSPVARVIPLAGISHEQGEATLNRELNGDYVQWILPGSYLEPPHVNRLLALTETQSMRLSLYMFSGAAPFTPLHPYVDLCGAYSYDNVDAKKLWPRLLAQGRYPVGGLDNLLLPRQVMHDCHWLLACLTATGLQLMSAWRALLGVTAKIFVTRGNATATRCVTAEEYIYHQLDWFNLLNEDNSLLDDEGLRAALALWRDNYLSLSANESLRNTEAWSAYAKTAAIFFSRGAL